MAHRSIIENAHDTCDDKLWRLEGASNEQFGDINLSLQQVMKSRVVGR